MPPNELVTFESAFDEFAPTPDKKLFKEAVLTKLATEGKIVIEVPDDGGGGDLLLKRMDAHVSQGYNVFNSHQDYQEWMQQSLHEPTDEEVMNSLKEQNGNWT